MPETLLLLLLVGFASAFPFPTKCGINYIEPSNIEGTRQGSNQTRNGITGGYVAVPGSWPWQAYLVFRGEFACGGTIISDQWIQTAGHCVYEGLNTDGALVDPNPNDWKVVLGEFDDSKDDGWEQTFDVEFAFLNPSYEDIETDWDTGLLKVKGQIEFNDWIAPACFPTSDQQFLAGQICITSGWGSIDPEGTEWGPTLKQEYAQLWSEEECNSVNAYDGWVNDRMQCAGFHLTGSEDPERCNTLGFGDSGGPLVCRAEDGKWTLVGATSWSSFCSANGYSPGVWARIQSMQDWIEATMDAHH